MMAKSLARDQQVSHLLCQDRAVECVTVLGTCCTEDFGVGEQVRHGEGYELNVDSVASWLAGQPDISNEIEHFMGKSQMASIEQRWKTNAFGKPIVYSVEIDCHPRPKTQQNHKPRSSTAAWDGWDTACPEF